ncbi:hypothetical protein [Allonocardiopsis opalescens]|uniref:Uncharacterized protein n=1 Tax=Allonocardiopsis opalescens TaxID=1144618 RepID=A0A2T0PPT6_9ACTN|nr:hypothetical protein [Allonocardiopsis opalescens]PRX90912.1 hypothetical protein CLV72_1158 [Allonocardiopsis opalescens]
MAQRSSPAAVAERIAAVDWAAPWELAASHAGSRPRLLMEYQRRMGLWARALGLRSPVTFFDLPERVAPGVRADPELVARVEAGWAGHYLWEPVRSSCLWALHWAAVREAGLGGFPGEGLTGARRAALAEPFDPLLAAYERGGGFHRDCSGAFIDLELCAVPYRPWRDRLPPADPITTTDPAALDALDAADTARRAAEGAPGARSAADGRSG